MYQVRVDDILIFETDIRRDAMDEWEIAVIASDDEDVTLEYHTNAY